MKKNMKVLISACVYGDDVRWNGSNKVSQEIVDWAKRIGLDLVPVCPEHELFGTPRKPIRLQYLDGKTVASMGKDDVYHPLVEKAKEIHSRHPDAVGFIGIARSPSCGIAVGVRKLGKTIKAPMHAQASFPTIEINSLRSPRERVLFVDRIVKYYTQKSCRGINVKE